MTDLTLEHLRGELAPIRAQLDGLPVINRALTVLQQDMRSLRAAFNDFARTNVTAGEVEALHADVNRVQAENAELLARLATVERLVETIAEGRVLTARAGADVGREPEAAHRAGASKTA
jgi:hypothetical protein